VVYNPEYLSFAVLLGLAHFGTQITCGRLVGARIVLQMKLLSCLYNQVTLRAGACYALDLLLLFMFLRA